MRGCLKISPNPIPRQKFVAFEENTPVFATRCSADNFRSRKAENVQLAAENSVPETPNTERTLVQFNITACS